MFEIKNTTKYGRGLFASKTIKKGTVIEICPALIFERDDEIALCFTKAQNYVFDWSKKRTALALGKSSLINHRKNPNIKIKINFKDNLIKFYAYKDIRKGSQLFIDYGYNVKNSETFYNLQKKDFVNSELEDSLYKIISKNMKKLYPKKK